MNWELLSRLIVCGILSNIRRGFACEWTHCGSRFGTPSEQRPGLLGYLETRKLTDAELMRIPINLFD